jgi:hypothetical protein
MLDELLHRLDSWAYLRIERRPGCVIPRVRDLVVGAVNPASQVVSVDVPAGMVDRLLDAHPHLGEAKDGVSVHLSDLNSRATADALLRWRIELRLRGLEPLPPRGPAAGGHRHSPRSSSPEPRHTMSPTDQEAPDVA